MREAKLLQNLRCSLIQAVSQEEPSDRKSDPWPLWMSGHVQLKFVMMECSKTQIRLTRPIWHYAVQQIADKDNYGIIFFTVNFLNIRTPKKFVVVILKFELCGSTIE